MKSYETEPREEGTSTASEVKDAQEEVTLDTVDVADDLSDTPEPALYQEELVEQPRQRRFSPPTREQLLNWAPFLGVVLLGALLRFWGLGDKPLHHDESLHAYFSLQLMHNLENWAACLSPTASCYHYDPLLHGPFQFHAIALVYKISQLLGVYDNGVNTTTVRIAAASLGTVIVGLPYFLRDYLGKVGAWLACFLLAISPSMVYFSRFAREDIYMACFTLLLVVAAARYVRSRKASWLVIAAVAFSLSYATKEATFLTVAIFGSFFVALLVWELGLKWRVRDRVNPASPLAAYLPRTGAPIALVALVLIAAPIAKIFFSWLKDLSIYITASKQATTIADQYVQGLKDRTVAIVPWIGILLGLYVLVVLTLEMLGRWPAPGRRGLATYVDPERQPLLDTVVTMPWTHWFFALLCGWAVFLVLFTVVFTNIRGGIGDGIWQGIYYWLQQQQVARGSQPWYYYLLLIPLYEQIGVVFGLAGLVRCLLRPTRFRLFLVYWFVGNLFIYSWAAEKMPWLMIHLTMPLLLLAAIGLEPIVVTLLKYARQWLPSATRKAAAVVEQVGASPIPQPARSPVFAGTVAGFVLALLLLLPTLQNMYQVTYVHPADGPHEMMIYVQTTTDVNIVMNRIEQLDQKYYGGRHAIPIGLMNDSNGDGPIWPFAWYLRDYTNVCFSFPAGCPTTARDIPIVITGGGDAVSSFQSQFGSTYAFHLYHLRSWWDEGYKPPSNDPTIWGGVGPLVWLSYGDNPPAHATFNPGLAIKNIWQWWWQRKPFGGTEGAYDMGLYIRKDTGIAP